jgi:YD repeat-containing protein
LSRGGNVVATIAVRNAIFLPPTATGTAVSFDVVRDDGQDMTFTVSGSTIVAPAGVTLRLTQLSSGYQLIDDDDNVEIYDATGKLLSVTARSGIVETLAYDSSNRLSTVTDSFGHPTAVRFCTVTTVPTG